MKIKTMLLTPNKYSRPQIELKKVTKIAVHYVGNPSSSAQANRNYFESLKDSHASYASSHSYSVYPRMNGLMQPTRLMRIVSVSRTAIRIGTVSSQTLHAKALLSCVLIFVRGITLTRIPI